MPFAFPAVFPTIPSTLPRKEPLAHLSALSPGAAPLSLTGTEGNDRLTSTDAGETIAGLGGHDVIRPGMGDHIDGGAGHDIVTFSTAYGGTHVGLSLADPAQNSGLATGITMTGVERIHLRWSNDWFTGDDAAQYVVGMGGSDRLDGGGGNDTLDGSAGYDVIRGGLGADVMWGGGHGVNRATDRFVWFSADETGLGAGHRDVIMDFNATGDPLDARRPGDRLELGRIDADTTRGFNQAFDFVGTSGFSGTAAELRYAQTGGVTLVQGDTDGDASADFEIELTGLHDLTEANFLL